MLPTELYTLAVIFIFSNVEKAPSDAFSVSLISFLHYVED
ncbi:hypothetical protein A6A12_0068 [Vibrio anguillarum]|nr:hypothetical protein A6A12_0068 [Vibrio anguillarum]